MCVIKYKSSTMGNIEILKKILKAECCSKILEEKHWFMVLL